ncbi:MAG: hypothetical protein NVSMB42_10870 [Herpetosiphon sp.]
MFVYTAYSLGIHSTFPLPELISAPGAEADVSIRKGSCGRPVPTLSDTDHFFDISDVEAYFFWDSVGAFLVRGGMEIIVDPLPQVQERLIRLPLLNIVLSAVLQQRGFLAVHASSVAIDGAAVAFVGGSGWGKSTLAAALYGRGFAVVADDMAVLSLQGTRRPLICPGFPQLKLFPEAATVALGDHGDELPLLMDGFEKRARRTIDRFPQHPLPLKRLYLLSKGPTVSIVPVTPQQALIKLVAHSYTSLLFNTSLAKDAATAHFLQCAQIVKTVPIYHLRRPQALPLLSTIVEMVEEHLSHEFDSVDA